MRQKARLFFQLVTVVLFRKTRYNEEDQIWKGGDNMVLEYMDFVSRHDPEVGAAIRSEYQRQCENIELIASENIVSEAVLEIGRAHV